MPLSFFFIQSFVLRPLWATLRPPLLSFSLFKTILLIGCLISQGWLGMMEQLAKAGEMPDSNLIFQMDCESLRALPNGWKSDGAIKIDENAAFQGKHSILLSRTLEQLDQPCRLIGPSFGIRPGMMDVQMGVRTDLKSPDASFNAVVMLDYLDQDGKVLDSATIVDLFGYNNWRPVSRKVLPPPQAVAARLRAQLQKATGLFWLDEINILMIAGRPMDQNIDRMVFKTCQLGNLLYPEDPRTVSVSVETLRRLPGDTCELNWEIRDYWGANCGKAGRVALQSSGQTHGRYAYTGQMDISQNGLEIGRYYEIHGTIKQSAGEPYHNYTSLAILPRAEAKNFKPEEIPFTSRTWDNTIRDYFYLTDRLGVRVCGVWGGWEKDPPYTPKAPGIEHCEKLGMGVLTGTPAQTIEHHGLDWRKLNEDALRQGMRNWLKTYGHIRPLVVNLGNEPPQNADRVLPNIAAYKALYEEIKKFDPSITVVASSMGPEEIYFQNGFQNYCDAYDFHVYEDYRHVRNTMRRYDELFKKYGGRKPIWSTEIGLNSQGMARQAVAVEVVRKITNFFAAGGANVSWFGLLYPDPDAKLHDDSSSAHNMFDCRYVQYAPKLDAIAYYNMVNGLCIKKIADEKIYEQDIHAYLFRDSSGRCMQIIWKEKGRRDLNLPLPCAGKVMVIDIDGRRNELNAGGTGITLTASEDPCMLLYESDSKTLPDALKNPSARIASVPAQTVKGKSATILVEKNPDHFGDTELLAPDDWRVTRANAGQQHEYHIQIPSDSSAREGRCVVRIRNGDGTISGLLRVGLTVTGSITLRSVPVPASEGQSASVKLIVANLGDSPQNVSWKMSLTGEKPIIDGRFKHEIPATSYFAKASEGTMSILGHASSEVIVPLANVDPLIPYGLRASVTDSSGRVMTQNRMIGGFVGVVRATGPIHVNGKMKEPDWQRASVQPISQPRQYMAYKTAKATWGGMDDLSGTVQFLWDDQYLYVGVKVRDNVFANSKVDGELWGGDGLQFLIDPCREINDKPGKYDIALALTRKGPQVWGYLSADSGSPVGEIKDIPFSAMRTDSTRGDMTYVVAIPWHRLAPFNPSPGANLGLAMIMNEDDGGGRESFMGWFGDCDAKQVDAVGDLILLK